MNITLDNIVLRHDAFEISANFKLTGGKKYAILGPSGCGKSTFFSGLAGFKELASGRILFGDVDVTNTPASKRPISLLFQDHNLFPHLTVAQNVALGIKPNLKLNAQDQATLANALDRVGLSNRATDRPASLSGGQQQRVAIARALLRQKPIMLLDEPFAALGPALKHEMLDLVSEIIETTNATLLMVTHDPDDAVYIADETIFVSEGRAAAPTKTQMLFDNPPPALQKYLGTKKGG